MAQYSSRLGRRPIAKLLGAWVKTLRDEKLIDASSFNLDFHSISYFGDDPFVEKNYVPRRSQRRKAVLTFFAQDAQGPGPLLLECRPPQGRGPILDHWRS